MDRPLTVTAGADQPFANYELTLAFEAERAVVTFTGEFDLTAAASVDQLLLSLDEIPLPVCLDLSPVTFIDSSGIEPIVEASRRRAGRHLPILQIDTCSPCVSRFLRAAGIGGSPILDLSAWDALGTRSAQAIRKFYGRG